MGAIFAPSRTTKHKKQTEESLQLKVCRAIRAEFPDVIFVCDYAGGFDMSDNQRRKMMAMRSHDGKAPDLTIFHPSRGYHGLVIELKKEGTVLYKRDGSLRKQPYTRRYKGGGVKRGDHLAEQQAMLKRYDEAGYCALFGVGYDHIMNIIRRYLDRQQLLF